jgi:polyphosphate glucokinase
MGFPSPASNIDKGWIECNVEELCNRYTGHQYYVLMMRMVLVSRNALYGRIKNERGTVLMLTLGTGIGSALFYDGVLVPNTEFGHLIYRDSIAEHWVSNRARKDRMLEYDTWASELAEFLDYTHHLVISKAHRSWWWSEFPV